MRSIKTRFPHTLVFMLFVWIGCQDKQETSTSKLAPRQGRVLMHASQNALESYLDALVYGDADGVFASHHESSLQSHWCSMDSFTTLLGELSQRKDEKSCEQARMLTSDADAMSTLSEEEQLMFQTLRFVCEQEREKPTCQDYAKKVFLSGLTQGELWREGVSEYTIQKISEVKSGEARAYVDLVTGSRSLLKKTITLVYLEDGQRWVVSD